MFDVSRRTFAAGLVATLASLSPRRADAAASGDVLKALTECDVLALEQWEGAPEERALAAASALALRRQDKAAEAELTAFAAGEAPAQMRAAGLSVLGGVFLRQGRFAEARAALSDAMRLDPGLDTDSQQQTLNFALALSDVPTMVRVGAAKGELPLHRDRAGLLRGEFGFGSMTQTAILDSGAGFSTMSESTARRLDLTFLTQTASVDSVSREAISTRFALVPQLTIGEVALRNVVFIVLPDEQLSFANGQYVIDAIIGLPVFLKMGCLKFTRGASGEALAFDPEGTIDGERNLILSGVQPLLLAETVSGRHPLRLFIDTGAKQTSLHRKAIDDYPDIGSQAQAKATILGGAGGTRTDEKALVIPDLELLIGLKEARLAEVRVLSKAEPDRHGELGQDVLNQGSGFVLDFNGMRFALLGDVAKSPQAGG